MTDDRAVGADGGLGVVSGLDQQKTGTSEPRTHWNCWLPRQDLNLRLLGYEHAVTASSITVYAACTSLRFRFRAVPRCSCCCSGFHWMVLD